MYSDESLKRRANRLRIALEVGCLVVPRVKRHVMGNVTVRKDRERYCFGIAHALVQLIADAIPEVNEHIVYHLGFLASARALDLDGLVKLCKSTDVRKVPSESSFLLISWQNPATNPTAKSRMKVLRVIVDTSKSLVLLAW